MSLFDQLKTALNPEPHETRDGDKGQRIAAAVLLLEMAHADNVHADIEYAEIRRQLRQYFALDDAEVEQLMAAATPEADNATSLHRYLQTLHHGLSVAEKRQVLEMLWRVAYADLEVAADEEHLLRQIAELLYLPHSEYIKAKLAVLGE